MKTKLLLIAFLGAFLFSFAQDTIPPYLYGKVKHPVFNFHPFMGVIDTDNTVLKYDSSIDYKIAIDVYDKVKDSSALYVPLREVGRVYNLNRANGVPEDKLKMVVVLHGFGIYSVLNDEAYEKKYGIKNPNTEALRQYKEHGIDFYICGQNLGFFNIPQEDLAPEIAVSISAKTALITFDQKGYTYMNVNED